MSPTRFQSHANNVNLKTEYTQHEKASMKKNLLGIPLQRCSTLKPLVPFTY